MNSDPKSDMVDESTYILVIDSENNHFDLDLTVLNENHRLSDQAIMEQLSLLDFSGHRELLYRVTHNNLLSKSQTKISILEAIKIHQEFNREFSVNRIKEIRIHSEFDNRYVPIVQDIAASCNAVTNLPDASNSTPYGLVTKALIQGFLGILIQFIWLIFTVFNKTDSSDVLFCYGPGRFKNKEPILEAANENYIDQLFISIGITPTFFLPEQVRDHRPVSLGRYSSINSIASSLDLLFRGVIPTIYSREGLASNVSTRIAEEFDVTLYNSLEANFQDAFEAQDYWIYPKYCVAIEMMNKSNCDAVVVGSDSALNQAILYAAEQSSVERFHTPHSVLIPRIWHPNTTHLVSGESEIEFLEDRVQDVSNYYATGRPYLVNLHQRFKDASIDTWDQSKSLRILIATQPFVNKCDVEDIVTTIDNHMNNVEIIIKIHPFETPSKYNSITSTNVNISATDLFDQIEQSHLVLFWNSNVGVEAMIAKTPAISFDPPSLMPFMEQGPIPVLKSRQELESWLEDFSNHRLIDIAEEQYSFVQDAYCLNPGAELRMLDVITGDVMR